MAYEHVAILPFLLDDAHLTPEEAVERAENPIAWASRRYAQPEHVFRVAAERYRQDSKNPALGPSPTAQSQTPPASSYRVPDQRSPPTAGRTAVPDMQLRQDQEIALLQPQQPPHIPITTSPSTAAASLASGSYFSTILSSSPLPEDMGIDKPSPSPESRDGGQSPVAVPETVRSGNQSGTSRRKVEVTRSTLPIDDE